MWIDCEHLVDSPQRISPALLGERLLDGEHWSLFGGKSTQVCGNATVRLGCKIVNPVER